MTDEEARVIIDGLRTLARVLARDIAAALSEYHGIQAGTPPSPVDLPPPRPPEPSPPAANKYVTAAELADVLNVPINSVRRYTREGLIPTLRLGRQYRYDMAAVLAALQGEDQAPGE